jgi:hypothetical protein
MSCELCVEEETSGSRPASPPRDHAWLVCNPCCEENSSVLVIVPGDRVVMARCDLCWRYGTRGDSLRSAQEDARTPTRALTLSARVRKGCNAFGGTSPAARLPAGQE